MPTNTGTSATVTVTVEVRELGTWEPDCTIEQIQEQALREAKSKLNRVLNKGDFRIKGDCRVDVITNYGVEG